MSDNEGSQSDVLTHDDFDDQNGDDGFDDNLDMDVDVDVDGEGEGDADGLDIVNADQSTVVSSVDGLESKRIGTATDFLVQSQSASARTNNKERSNAKPVEVYDLDNNLLKIYNSGTLAARDLNIQQGDISLCCRGMKASIGGYKFKFSGTHHIERPEGMKLKRGFAYVPVMDGPDNLKNEVTQRTTRASRGEYGMGVRAEDFASKSILAPPSLKVLP